MRRKGFTWVEALILFAVIFVIAAILFPLFARSREPHGRSCQSNLKQIGLGFMQYVQDWDEAYPPVALKNVSSSTPPFSKPFGWADTLYPYLKSTQIFHCSSENNLSGSSDATQNNFTDYWMNSSLSNLRWEKIKQPPTIILAGDGNDGTDVTNARYSINALPQKWISDKNSPAYRHLDGAYYLFADGHVKHHTPETIETTPVSQGGPTFSIK